MPIKTHGTEQRADCKQRLRRARRTLRAAFSKLRQANKDRDKLRLAAYRGWQAAQEALHAVLLGHGLRILGTMPTVRVAEFEAKVLGRGHGMRQPLTIGHCRAKMVLRDECFHDGMLPRDLHGELLLVGHLIDQAALDVARRGGAGEVSTCPTCGKKALRAVTETVEFPIPGRPLKIPDVPHLKCSACGERLFGPESEPAIHEYHQRHRRHRAPRDSVDRAIREGRRDYARGDFIGPFSSAAEMDAALGGQGAGPAINQCDGCRAGKPLKNAAHRMGEGEYPDWMTCQAYRYGAGRGAAGRRRR